MAEETEEGFEEEEANTEEEFQALFAESVEAKERLLKLAAAKDKDGKPEIAALYRELAGTVLSLVEDVSATCGAAFADIESDVDRLSAGMPPDSMLLSEDGERYVACFEQTLRFLRELRTTIPSSETEQLNIFDALIRMNDEMLGFTKEITADEPEEPETPAGEEPTPPN